MPNDPIKLGFCSILLDILPEERQAPGILHGKLSAALAARFFGVTDPAVLAAIRCHTTLRAGASPLDKLLLVADKLSWDPADAPFHADLVAALNQSLDDAVRCFLTWTWQQRDKMPVVHPWLRQACSDMDVPAGRQAAGARRRHSLGGKAALPPRLPD
ncbi:MAG: bis(5'-nucleosyl)-tetraphosphatase (symmetrical) YqeK [Symbiobacteriia bacterium]